MKKAILLLFALTAILACGGAPEPESARKMLPEGDPAPTFLVKAIMNEAAQELNITVNDEPFTAYCFWDRLKKPIFYPLLSPDGRKVTRSYGVELVPGERVDHPHQRGCWFNYGNVNGDDFWNNSDSVDQSGSYGKIVHKGISDIKSEANRAEFDAYSVWVHSTQGEILDEKEHVVIRADQESRIIDRIITLTARDKQVIFHDSKEGMLGIRVARGLEEPSNDPVRLVRADLSIPEDKIVINEGVDGLYLASTGRIGSDQVWGTRAKWCALNGTLYNRDVSIVIFDHPDNPGYPTYWHARGYGLFAANPLGWKLFTDGKEEFNLTLAPGESVSFRFRVLTTDRGVTPSEGEKLYNNWLEDYKAYME